MDSHHTSRVSVPMKPWYKSKTIWKELLAGITIITVNLNSSATLLGKAFGVDVFTVIVAVFTIAGIALRFVTDSGIFFKKEADDVEPTETGVE